MVKNLFYSQTTSQLFMLFSSKSDKYSPHETRHLDYITRFTSDIQYIKDEANIVVDTISRTSIYAISTETLSYENITEE